MIVKEAAVMLVIKDGLILGIPRKNDKTKFGMAGGKCEENELPIVAAIRETNEESGIVVSDCVPLAEHIEPAEEYGGPYYTFCFYATKWSGEISFQNEECARWITKSELFNGVFINYNKNVLNVFSRLYPEIYKTLKE